MREHAINVAAFLKVLANENRLLILCELVKKPMMVNELLEKIDITQSGVSQHLSILKSNQIVQCRKKGQHVIYGIKDERVIEVMEVLKELYCK